MVTRCEDHNPATDHEKVFATYRRQGPAISAAEIINTKAEANVAENIEGWWSHGASGSPVCTE